MSAWNIALRSLGRRRLRTGLTASGIAVGVALMLTLLSLASGMDVQMRQMIRAFGGADITVSNATGLEGEEFVPGRFFGVARTLNESVAQLISQIPGVYAVSPQLSFNGYVNGVGIIIYGIDPIMHSTIAGELNIVDGRPISEGNKYEIILGRTVADSLNVSVWEDVIVSITPKDGKTFTVVGIFETEMIFLEYSGYITLRDAQNITNQLGLVTQVSVKCMDPNEVDRVSDLISASIPGVRVTPMTVMVQRASQMLNALTMFFATISLVSLSAGSLGAANTMIMSVSERTREIGILKAMGAKDLQVLKIFLTEALLLGLLGGVVGIIVGATLSYTFPMLTGEIFRVAPFGRERAFPIIAPIITPPNIILCFLLGTLVGVLAGFYPAWRAARMRPIEALRYV